MRQNTNFFPLFAFFFSFEREGVVTIVNTTTPRYVETQRPTGRTARPWAQQPGQFIDSLHPTRPVYNPQVHKLGQKYAGGVVVAYVSK